MPRKPRPVRPIPPPVSSASKKKVRDTYRSLAGGLGTFSPLPPPPPPPFSPLGLPGLALWLRADLGVWADLAKTVPGNIDGTAVALWADQSGLGGDFQQPTSTNRPHYQAAVQNGLPMIYFTPDISFLQGTGAALTALSGVPGASLFYAYKPNFTGNNRRLVHCSIGTSSTARLTIIPATTDFQPYLPRATERRLDADGATNLDALSNPVMNGVAAVLGVTVDWINGPYTLYKDGGITASSTAPGTGPTSPGPAFLFQISGSAGINNTPDVWAGEICLWGRVLSTSEIAAISAYLRSRWGTP
jgi:hypothetical protein